jgi:hypothetical protein
VSNMLQRARGIIPGPIGAHSARSPGPAHDISCAARTEHRSGGDGENS